MNAAWEQDERLVDLLVKQATEGLDGTEDAELSRLLAAQPAATAEAVSLEPTAAAVWLAADLPEEAMPAALEARLIAEGEALVRANASTQSPAGGNVVEFKPRRGAGALPPEAGWWAAAACLVLAVAGWYPRLTAEPTSVAPAQVAEVAVAPPSIEQQRDGLLSRGAVVKAEWSVKPDPAAQALVGDVVWDPATQRGFFRFRNIPVNDPRLQQYQAWIVDATRKEREEKVEFVDAGVFNVADARATAGGDVIVPFEAKLPVGKAAAFAITVEQPGGVVVSKQDRVLALAPVTQL